MTFFYKEISDRVENISIEIEYRDSKNRTGLIGDMYNQMTWEKANQLEFPPVLKRNIRQ